jgi:hypothetical protein
MRQVKFCINKTIISSSRVAPKKAEKQRAEKHEATYNHQENIMSEQKKIARRSFFAGLGLVAAAGVAAKLAPASVAEAVAEQPAEPEGISYRLSEHVKKYYRTTTI